MPRMRIAIVGLLAVGAIILLYLALSDVSALTRYDFMLNVGTEVLGIAVTVGMVDWLLELQRRRERGKTIAWKALHEIDLVVWLWQGGSRSFNVSELWHLVTAAGPSDPMIREVRNRFFNLGAQAENTLRINPEEVRSQKHLNTALERLAALTTILDVDEVNVGELLQNIRAALALLARIHGLPATVTEAARVIVQRDPSPMAQELRVHGRDYYGAAATPSD